MSTLTAANMPRPSISISLVESYHQLPDDCDQEAMIGQRLWKSRRHWVIDAWMLSYDIIFDRRNNMDPSAIVLMIVLFLIVLGVVALTTQPLKSKKGPRSPYEDPGDTYKGEG
jgi:hypothetical protein